MSEDPNIIKKAFNKYGPGSINAVKRMAKNAGLSQKAAIEWYQQNGRQKDTVKGKVFEQARNYGVPIFSQRPGGWQFDTVCPKVGSNGKYFLWFVNTNTRETRAYEMPDKSADSVEYGMKQFLLDTKNNRNKGRRRPVISLTSDRDPAYATDSMLKLYEDNGINYRTTTDTSKNILGIFNRNIKMIRDRIANTGDLVDENNEKGMSGNMTKEQINLKLSGWNNEKNENLGGHSPWELSQPENRDREIDYIANKMNLADARREEAFKGITEGMKVRRFRIGEKGHAEKNLDPYTWTLHHVDKLRGKVYLGTDNEKDGLVEVPRYQIDINQEKIKGLARKPPLDLLNKVPMKIVGWKGGNYDVVNTDGSRVKLTQRELRGNQPLNPLKIEEDFKKSQQSQRTTTMTTRSTKKL